LRRDEDKSVFEKNEFCKSEKKGEKLFLEVRKRSQKSPKNGVL